MVITLGQFLAIKRKLFSTLILQIILFQFYLDLNRSFEEIAGFEYSSRGLSTTRNVVKDIVR